MKQLSFWVFTVLLCAAQSSCSSGSGLELADVVDLPQGDGAGEQLSGVFTVLFERTGGSCKLSDLEVIENGATVPLEVTIAHQDGSIEFAQIDTTLRGGVSFENEFEVGGAALVDRGDEGTGNVLQLVHFTGTFSSVNQFTGEGSERFTGRVNNEPVDCTLEFRVEGSRKAS